MCKVVKVSSLYIGLLIALFSLLFVNQVEGKDFVVVIDAGHGGKDPGAKGRSINEKTINLSVAQKLGSLITQNHKDVKVVYTRKTDVFVDLDERRNELERESKRQRAILKIKHRYGKNAILRGINFEDGATMRERNQQVGGHKA